MAPTKELASRFCRVEDWQPITISDLQYADLISPKPVTHNPAQKGAIPSSNIALCYLSISQLLWVKSMASVYGSTKELSPYMALCMRVSNSCPGR